MEVLEMTDKELITTTIDRYTRSEERRVGKECL